MKKQSFAKGAALLAVATGLGKILSAIFKIPLDRLFLHADGMAIFNSAYNFYMLFFSVATAGIPMAISSLVASARDDEEERSILSTSLIFIQGILFAAGLLIFIFADTIANWTGLESAAIAFRVMAPALCFCGFTASFKGFFQGKRIMTPSAISQVCDSFGRLILGFSLVFVLSSQPLHIKASGAIAGVPFGALLSAGILVGTFVLTKNRFRFSFSWKILKNILLLAVPITLTSSLHAVFNMADTLSVVPTLEPVLSNAPTAFGCLTRSQTLYALPVSIATAVSTSILPAVSENIKNKNFETVNYESNFALRLALIVSVPCCAGFIAISPNIFNLLYNDSTYHSTLMFIAPSAVLLSAGTVLSCILQGMKKSGLTVIAAVIAILSKMILNPILLSFLKINGAAVSTSVSYLIFVLFCVFFTHKSTPVRFRAKSVLLKPLVCGLLCFATAFWAIKVSCAEISIVLAALVYVPSIFITRLITKEELKQIFGG